MTQTNGRNTTDGTVLSGMMAGVAGGIAGAWMMNRFQSAWTKAGEALSSDRDQQPDKPSKQEPATAKAADAVSEQVFHHHLTTSEKKTAEPTVHYAFGAIMGGLYGSLAAWRRETAAAAGLPFGTALWFFADEIGVPAAGLSSSSLKAPLSTHVNALLSHLVYGLTTEAVRRSVLAASAAASAR